MQPFRYCPHCAHELEMRPGNSRNQHHLTCPNCGFVAYENSKPTAGALVVRDGHLLLARRRHDPAKGKWDLLGGFLLPGEHPRDGAIREIREETGLEIEPTRLIGLYIDRYGDDGDWILNCYYEATVVSGEPRAADDVSELRWFVPDDLPNSLAFNHQSTVIADWKYLSLQDRGDEAEQSPRQ